LYHQKSFIIKFYGNVLDVKSPAESRLTFFVKAGTIFKCMECNQYSKL